MKVINKSYSVLLLIGFGIILLLMTGVIVSSVVSMNKTRQHLNVMFDEHLAKVALAMNMRAASHSRTLTLYKFMYFDDPFKRDDAWMGFNDAASDFLRSRSKILSLPLSETERDLLNSIQKLASVAALIHRRVIDLLNNGMNDDARFLLNDKAVPAQTDVRNIMDRFVAYQWSMVEDAQREVIAEIETMRSVIFFFGIAALFAGVGIAVVIVNIIRQRTELEKQLNRSQKMDAIGKLTGGIAHDYNNMLAIILGFAGLLKGRVGDDAVLGKWVDQISHAADRGAKLTSKLLSFTRTKSSNEESLMINTLLEYEKDILEKTITARIKLHYEFEDELWPVLLDSGDFEDSIINLCINSMHAIDGNGDLTIKTNNVALKDSEARALELVAGDYVQISFADTGCGMNEVTKSKMFDPFYTTKNKMGTGLGLSQVFGFVQRSKGSISVTSELGKGTELRLYFPRNNIVTSSIEPDNKKLTDNLNGTETILVVDDEEALRNLTSVVLTQHGYKVICANDGKHALEILEKESVDLLFSDVIMPEIDGFQLAAIVHKKYPAIKVQLASGYTDNREKEHKKESWYNEILYKPFDGNALLRVIRKLLDSA